MKKHPVFCAKTNGVYLVLVTAKRQIVINCEYYLFFRHISLGKNTLIDTQDAI
jgi:hypothetical protein